MSNSSNPLAERLHLDAQHHAKKPFGFTLMEILVVMLIIGIVSGAALYSFGDFGGKRKILLSVEHFKAYTNLLQHRAIIESNTLGIRINAQGYAAYRLFEAKTWIPMPASGIFRPQIFPSHIKIQFKTRNKNAPDQPTMTISPTGELSPILIIFGTEQTPNLVQFSTLKHDKTELIYA